MISMASHSASSSSSVSNNSFTYQVFLSFRGEDTRHNITDTLYRTLCEKGIDTFIDDQLPKGEKISAELVKAIKESEVSIIVFSENYAGSRWCLDELVEILQCKASNQHQVRPIFYKVDPSHVRHQKGKFGYAFKQLDQVGKYKDSMAKWREALSDAANLNGWPFSDGESEFEFIRKIVKELSTNVLMSSNYLEVAKYPIGIDSHRQHVEKLLDMKNGSVQMVGIWGPGGVGKSTIAKAVFNSIGRNFEGCCFLADVRSNSIPHGGLDKLRQTLLSDMRVSTMRMMQRKKVLLVLDDVSDLPQLEKLAPSIDCFGLGSRILITTRDQRWLAAHEVNLVYEVEMMDDVRASELFSRHAFKCNGPPNDYLQLTQRAIHYAGGLPLALVVLGSHLFRRSKYEWEVTLDSCRGDHRSKIGEVLRISYDALGDDLKEFFLDIACFFKGLDITLFIPILEACHEDLKPMIGLAQLQDKSLIRIERVDTGFKVLDSIWMHDLIEEMGKDIGKCNRLWNWDDIERALRDNTGTKEIKGIKVPVLFGHRKISLNAKSFSKMKNLKYMDMGYMNFEPSSVVINYLSNELRWLDWSECPLLSFPTNFSPRKLVRLSISDSCIIRLWEGRNILPFLKYLELEDCESLVELPDFIGMPNLESLILYSCTSLVEMHDSMGALHKLVTLRIDCCYKLIALPEFNGKMSFLRELTLSLTGITELDSSIGKLIGLQELTIEDFENLMILPSSILNELKNLKKLNVHRCQNFVRFPFINKKMESLRELHISACGIKEVDGSIRNLTGLQGLSLRGCKSLKTLPRSIYGLQNLQTLIVRKCHSLTTFPTNTKNLFDDNGSGKLSLPKLEVLDIGGCNLLECDFLETLDCLDTLTNLDLSGNTFLCHLPKCIGKFLKLEKLHLSKCQRLREIPELPPNLVKVDASDCYLLERFWNLSEALEWQQITGISLWNCCNLGFNIVSLEGLLLNIQAYSSFCVVFPGIITAEEAKWLDCWKAVIGTDDQAESWMSTYSCKGYITIAKNLKWENLGLAVIAESVQGTKFTYETEIFINGVSVDDYHWTSYSEGSSYHVWVLYIPLFVEMKVNVDDQKGYSSLPHYECVAEFVVKTESNVYDRQPLHNFGVHLVCKESKDDENYGDNDASDFPELTNPRQQTRHRRTKSV